MKKLKAKLIIDSDDDVTICAGDVRSSVLIVCIRGESIQEILTKTVEFLKTVTLREIDPNNHWKFEDMQNTIDHAIVEIPNYDGEDDWSWLNSYTYGGNRTISFHIFKNGISKKYDIVI